MPIQWLEDCESSEPGRLGAHTTPSLTHRNKVAVKSCILSLELKCRFLWLWVWAFFFCGFPCNLRWHLNLPRLLSYLFVRGAYRNPKFCYINPTHIRIGAFSVCQNNGSKIVSLLSRVDWGHTQPPVSHTGIKWL